MIVVVLVVLNLGQSQRGVINVQTQKVGRGDVVSVVSGSGRIQPKTKVNITSEVTAEVIGLQVKEGDYVEKGRSLIRLDTLQAQKDMESTLYADNELQARLEGAKITLPRLLELDIEGAAPARHGKGLGPTLTNLRQMLVDDPFHLCAEPPLHSVQSIEQRPDTDFAKNISLYRIFGLLKRVE